MASSNPSAAFSLDHHLSPPPPPPPPLEQLCYVHCNFCDTDLAVSVPCSSLFRTVTVRCGHCTNLLPVNMRGLLLPAAANQLHLGHAFLPPPPPPPPPSPHHSLLDEIACPPPPSMLMDLPNLRSNNLMRPAKGAEEDQHPQNNSYNNTAVNRPPEKRQRVPSAYNRFIKDEIQRIKAGNPDITHREAFSAAAKNWAHFPHIHFGLMPDRGLKKNSIRQQEGGEDVLLKDGFYAAAAAAANMGVTPF